MTAPEPSPETPEAPPLEQIPSYRGAFGIYARAHKFGVGWVAVCAVMAAATALASSPIVAAVVSLPVFLFMLALPFKLRGIRQRARRRINREMLTRAAREVGGVEVDAFRSTFAGRLRHVVRSSKSAFVGGAFLGVLFSGLLLFTESPMAALGAAVLWAVVMVFSAALLTLRDALGFDKEAAADAQAELAYREAVKDRTQLGGSLQVSADAGDSSGGLSMRADAGGLEVAQEVVLGFDDVEESAQAAAPLHVTRDAT